MFWGVQGFRLFFWAQGLGLRDLFGFRVYGLGVEAPATHVSEYYVLDAPRNQELLDIASKPVLHKTSQIPQSSPNNQKTTKLQNLGSKGLPVTEKTYLFKEVYIETVKRNPKPLNPKP